MINIDLQASPDAFIDQMIEANIHKGYVVLLDQQPQTSSDEVMTLNSFITQSPDYQGHEGIFWEIDPETYSLFIAAVHRTHRGAGQGGTRLKQYDTLANIFTDALRLAKGMTDKNACAGLWWGGGKSVIHSRTAPQDLQGAAREAMFAQFGRFIASLNGVYVCAEDMNVSPEDLRIVHAHNRFCTCVPQEIGGSSNPSVFTARGVFMGLLAGIHFLDATEDRSNTDLSGKHVLVQGAGNVGGPLVDLIVQSGGRVTLFDISERTIADFQSRYTPEQVAIERDLEKFYTTPADVFAPCAIGAILNDQTIPNLKVKMVAGAANNQLKDPVEHSEMLHDRGILYVPDFIINRMGIVNCANEQYGYLLDTIEEKILETYDFTYNLLQKAKSNDTSPEFMAMQMAEQLSRVDHPIWGHRGLKLIQQLVDSHWEA